MKHSKEQNKPQQEHIASIYKEYTTPSRVLRSFTNLANTVIQTALSGQSKFVFEILQNADDAYEDQHKPIDVKFSLLGKYLIVNHNGKGFDFNDVERICDYASQIEEVKATDLRKTGYKGLGFKSLFNLSDCIYIYSNGYSFRFDKGYWPDPESKPWQVIPIWCKYEELPLVQLYPYEEPVNLILKVNDVAQLESQLRELIDQPELLLYMFRINKLSVSLNEEKHFLERRIEKFGGFSKIDFYKNQRVESSWLSKDYKRPVSTEVQTFIQGASRFIYPEKIKNAKEVTLTFALRSENALKEISRIRGLCYSTLPTQLHLTLPYHINSQFILNLDRTQLHENEWNEYLVYQLGYLQFHLLKDLAEMEYLKNYVLQLFVCEIKHPYVKFSKAFSSGFMLAKEKIGWLPSHQGNRLLKLGEVWTDETEFFKQNFKNIRNNKIYPYLINYEVKSQHYLSSPEVEAKHFTYLQLFKDFPNKYYPQLIRGAYKDFITYLYRRLKDSRVVIKLKSVPFLVAKDGTLQSPKDALLEESENPIPNFFLLNTIDNDCLPLKDVDSIKDWLTHLGARRLSTPIQVLRESVLKWIDSGNLGKRINTENHIGIINYLVQGVKQLTNKETEKLQEKLLIFTESKQFKLARLCYFPDAVSVKELSNISDDEIISSSYNMKNLREFFLLVGVTNSLNPIDVLRKSVLMWIGNGEIKSKLTINNYTPIIEFLASNYFMLQHNLTEPEIMELRKMPVLTCGQTFQKAQDCYFDSAVPKIKGLEGLVANNRLVSTKHSSCVTKFLTKLGVSKNMAPIDVIRKSILKWIQEGYITKRITKDNHHDILKYIGDHWNILNSSVGLKAKEKRDLRKMPILTESGGFRAADSCYWPISDYCEEIPGLKSIISFDELVFSGYQLRVIKVLLEDIGVHNLGFTDICEKYSDHLTHKENVKWFFSQLLNYWKRNKANNDQLLNCLQQKFRDSPCLLAKNDKMYCSTQLYSSYFDNICDIDRNTLLVLQYERLPDDLEKYFGFKTDLDLKCIKQLLRAIDTKTKLGQDKTLIFFTTILKQLRQKDKNEIVKSQLSLLSADNKLRLAKNLNYFIEENATCSLKSCYLKRIFGMTHDETLELAKLCGVNTIPFQQEIIREKETPDDSLKEFYLERLPFIVLQESKKLYEDIKITLKRLYDAISAIKLYQCHIIHVKYPFGDITNVQHHFDGLTLYVVDKWYRKKSTIHEYLKEKLGFKTDIRDILDMGQPLTQYDKEYWLSSQREDPRELHYAAELLKEILPKKENGQLDVLTLVKIVKKDQDHPSEYEGRHFKDGNEEVTDVASSDETTSSDKTASSDITLSSDESFTDRVCDEDDRYLRKKKTSELESREVGTVSDKLKVSAEASTNRVIGEDITKAYKKLWIPSEDDDDPYSRKKNMFKQESEDCGVITNELPVLESFEGVVGGKPKVSTPHQASTGCVIGEDIGTKALIPSVHYSSTDSPKVDVVPFIPKEFETINKNLTSLPEVPCSHYSSTENLHVDAEPFIPKQFETSHKIRTSYPEEACSHCSSTESIHVHTAHLIPSEFETSHANRIPQPELTGSNYFSTEGHQIDTVRLIPSEFVTCHQNHTQQPDAVSFIPKEFETSHTIRKSQSEVACSHYSSTESHPVHTVHLIPSEFETSLQNRTSQPDAISFIPKEFETSLKISIAQPEVACSHIASTAILQAPTVLPILSEFETSPKNRIPQPELSDSNYPSTERLQIGTSKSFSGVNGERSDIKWLSEKYVFTSLQKHYKNKYPNAKYIMSGGIFLVLGRQNKIEIVWINESGEQGKPYDILLKKEGKVKRVIEVISSNEMANNGSFTISHHKFIKNLQLSAEIPDHKDKYCIYLVYNTNRSTTPHIEELNSSAALYKVVSLRNP